MTFRGATVVVGATSLLGGNPKATDNFAKKAAQVTHENFSSTESN